MGIGAIISTVASVGGAAARRNAAKRAGRRRVSSLERAQDFIRQGTSGARNELSTGFGSARDALNNSFSDALGVQQAGLQDIIQALQGQTGEAISTLQGGQDQGINTLLAALSGAEDQLNPFAQNGRAAFDVQSALSGALGPEAQANAIANFQESPATQFLRDTGERSIARNLAATGGIGGGQAAADFAEFNQGLANQSFNDFFNRLGTVSTQGQNAANLLAQANLGTGTSIADLIRSTSGNIAGLQGSLGQQLANAFQSSTGNISNLLTSRGGALAGLETQLGSSLAQLLLGQGTNLANLQQGIGDARANAALGSGEALAGLFDDIGGIASTTFG